MGESYWAGDAGGHSCRKSFSLVSLNSFRGGEVLPVALLHLLSLSPHSVRLSPAQPWVLSCVRAGFLVPSTIPAAGRMACCFAQAGFRA